MGDDKRALFTAVAAAASAVGGDGDDSSAQQYESLLAYVKRHSSRYVWWQCFKRHGGECGVDFDCLCTGLAVRACRWQAACTAVAATTDILAAVRQQHKPNWLCCC